jgi:hypothetical protein
MKTRRLSFAATETFWSATSRRNTLVDWKGRCGAPFSFREAAIQRGERPNIKRQGYRVYFVSFLRAEEERQVRFGRT